MPKQGMSRPEWTHVKPRNDEPPVPEIREKPSTEKPKENRLFPKPAARK